ncbi:phosphoglycerol transferase MdoB-like AlkP superfamily enzyme [Gulbenkiania mobilis]|uniref:Phosphoglycerol transferase MdoB-like AlkP superfamily enzyme n=2 Tax=Gulbenkiania mobilis TaxID=397457 RepID=A0ABY2CX74_GULMO|nr:phosphoglycerol transferase MdoB-like AlkP superfamily enzyme [Gulbenkiania mobilis]
MAPSMQRYAFLGWLVPVFLALSTMTRIALGVSLGNAMPGPGGWLEALAVGVGYDLVTAAYVALPYVLWLTLFPMRWRTNRTFATLGLAVRWLTLAGLVFVALAEWLFWQEFGSRFNFIAVDYLVYTHEVIGNIRESYPVGPLLAGVGALAALGVWATRRLRLGVLSDRSRLGVVAGFSVVTLASCATLSGDSKDLSANHYVNELSGNGIYSFFAAYRNNELDYARFYRTLPAEAAMRRLRALVATPEASFVSSNPYDLTRRIRHTGPEKHLNVVLISVESLSSDFMGVFGNKQGLTPNLDHMAQDGLFFSRMYATGTRTVRGLEALSLAAPPTPGQSIVRRPGNEGLFTMATVFNERGYESRYLYGGYGYFDNMNAYFSANGYTVKDRLAIDSKDIHAENVWGVADEDLFTLGLREFDSIHQSGKPFFAHLMTTSNHRPFTFPTGRVNRPQGDRDAAVAYTDWAIGDFVRRARSHPWFADTVFVIVADHQASSAGKTDLPVNRYHIPLIVWSPGNVAPARVDRLMSQIDVAPTLFGLLNFSYTSRFIGQDVFARAPEQDRAFISTYQALGLLRPDRLAILEPKGHSAVQAVINLDTGEVRNAPSAGDEALLEDAIAYYQGASQAFRQGLMKAPGR